MQRGRIRVRQRGRYTGRGRQAGRGKQAGKKAGRYACMQARRQAGSMQTGK